jgi:hypothetical protein
MLLLIIYSVVRQLKVGPEASVKLKASTNAPNSKCFKPVCNPTAVDIE